jgi:hypothetical protein
MRANPYDTLVTPDLTREKTLNSDAAESFGHSWVAFFASLAVFQRGVKRYQRTVRPLRITFLPAEGRRRLRAIDTST